MPERAIKEVCRELSMDDAIAKNAIDKLTSLRDPRSADALDAYLTKVGDAPLRALRVLANLRDPRAVGHLRRYIEGIDGQDPGRLVEPLKLLVTAGDPHAMDELGAFLLEHPSSASALAALARVGDERCLPYLHQALRDDPSWWTLQKSYANLSDKLGQVDIVEASERKIHSVVYGMGELGHRIGVGRNKIVLEVLIRLIDDPEFRNSNEALFTVQRHITGGHLKQDPVCRQVMLSAAARWAEQGGEVGKERSARVLEIFA